MDAIQCYGLLAIVIWKLYTLYAGRHLPPGPFAWPIFGNIRMFRKDPNGVKKFREFVKTYGNVYRCVTSYISVLSDVEHGMMLMIQAF